MIVPGTQLILPAYVVAPGRTRQPGAWLQSYVSVRLTEGIFAVRVLRSADTEPLDVDSLPGLLGRWFAIGDYVHSYASSLLSLDLSAAPGEANLMYLHSGSTLNVGICNPSLSPEGRGEQAEFISGTPPRLEPLHDYFSRFGKR